MRFLTLAMLLLKSLNIYSATFSQLETQLFQLRLDYYNKNHLPTISKLDTIYTKIHKITNNNEVLHLNILYGIISSEYLLYSKIDTNLIIRLEKIYKSSTKLIKKQKDSALYQRMGEWALFLTRINKKQERNYALDARTFFLYSIKYNKKNIKAQIGLGKWWAWNVITSNSREVNHSYSQAEQYLSDSTIQKLQQRTDQWDSIDISRIYLIRSMMRMRMLKTQSAFNDLRNSRKIFPHFIGNSVIQTLYSNNQIKWY